MPTKTLDEVVGEKLKEFRERTGYSYTQIADAARIYGARWGSSGVRAIERGEASLTLDKLLILALVLQKLTDNTLSLADLLIDETDYAIGDKTSPIRTSNGWLLEILRGGEIAPPVVRSKPAYNPETGVFMQRIGTAGELAPDLPDGFSSVVPTGAEQRAAKKLGVPAMAISWAARSLWKHSLDDEARARAGKNSTPQARGRVTRVLTEELTAHLEQHGQRNG